MSAHEVLLYLLLNLAIIIAAARLMGMAAKRVGQPAVIGEIAAGVIMGPTVLGRLASDFQADLFPSEVPLEEIASLGLVFFMFLVGLELDLTLIRRQARRAAQISLAGIALPLTLGALLALALYSVNQDGTFHTVTAAGPPSKTTFALFMGAAMCITAFPILARMLVETGLYRTPVGLTTLCAGAVDDVVAWILLAGVVGIAQGGSPAAAGEAFILTALFAVFMGTAGRWALGKLAARHEATGRLTVDQVAIVLAGVLLSAYVTELIGVHAIFGAFIFGTVMPKRAAMTHQLTEKIEDFTVIVLLPVFFLVAGLRTNLLAIDSLELVGWTLLILAVATLGKFAGCGIAARLSGAGTRDATVIGALMNTRGLTELVILTIGLELGVLSDRTFAMMVIMALATTVLAAPVVNRLMPRDEILAQAARGDRPSPAAGRIMILAGAGAPVRSLAALAARLLRDRKPAEVLFLWPLAVARTPELRSGLAEGEMRADEAESELQPVIADLAARGIGARSIVVLSEDPVADMASICDEQPIDLVLIGWSRSPGDLLSWRRLTRRAMHRVRCDVAGVADSTGPASGPLLLVKAGGSHDAAAELLASALAAEGETVLAGEAALAQSAGMAVLALPDDWPERTAFGAGAAAALEAASGPVLLVRSSSGTGAPRATLSGPPNPGWPFATPSRPRGNEPSAEPIPVPHLQRVDDYGVAVERHAIGSGLRIGRAEGNDLRLASDQLASRRHAEVRPEGGGIQIADLGSTNGTLLWRDGDWLPVQRTTFRDGDLAIIGSNVFRFSSGSQQEGVDGNLAGAR